MALAEYLAKNYLSADSKSSKKRKRKDASKSEGITIEDDDSNDWRNSAQRQDEDDTAPVLVGGGLPEGLSKPGKKANWIKIGASAPKDSDQAAADAILADAQAESNARAIQDDDAPAIVDEDGGEVEGPMMASGAMAGLQTADQVTAALKRKEKAERKAMKEAGMDPTAGKAQETIYRDASGRIINVAMKRAEMRAKAEAEERKMADELEARKGDVQRREKEERKQALEDAKVMGVARYADDKALNEELKEVERWNDPMAKMVGTSTSKSKKGKKGGKTYQGAFEPNRYGIRPGWRWDGVDRSNGFEKKWFAARNKQKNREELEYMWQMDE
jgi:pre-mRNA-splicing factor CWC26